MAQIAENERERIGAKLRAFGWSAVWTLRMSLQLADIDASNLSRIEKGKYSAGLDILCRIAAAMDCHLDIVPNSNRVNMAGHIIPENPTMAYKVEKKCSCSRN